MVCVSSTLKTGLLLLSGLISPPYSSTSFLVVHGVSVKTMVDRKIHSDYPNLEVAKGEDENDDDLTLEPEMDIGEPVIIKYNDKNGEEYKTEVSIKNISKSSVLKSVFEDNPDTKEIKLDILTDYSVGAGYALNYLTIEDAKKIINEELLNEQKPLKSKNFLSNKLFELSKNIFSSEQIDNEVLYSTMLAANYLDLKLLVELCASLIASIIKGEEIGKIQNKLEPTNTLDIQSIKAA